MLPLLVHRVEMMDFTLWVDDVNLREVDINCSVGDRICVSVAEATVEGVVRE
jgi:hypothetical protein